MDLRTWFAMLYGRCAHARFFPVIEPVSRHGTDDTDGKATRLGGEMGNGIMMNSQLSYLDNKILEGNTIVRWSAMGGGSYLPGFDKFYNGNLLTHPSQEYTCL